MIEPVRGVIGNGPVQKGIPFSPERPAPAGRLAGASGQSCASEFGPQFGSRGVVDFARLASVKQIAACDALRCRADVRAPARSIGAKPFFAMLSAL